MWSTSRSVQGSAQFKATLQIWHFTVIFIKFLSNLLVQEDFVWLHAPLSVAILNLTSRPHLEPFLIRLPR